MGHILTKNVFFNLRIESTPRSLVTPLEFGMAYFTIPDQYINYFKGFPI
jgi:hypothetical protein